MEMGRPLFVCFATVALSALLVAQDVPRFQWTRTTKTGSKIRVSVPGGREILSNAFLELLDVVESLVIVRDDASDLVGAKSASSVAERKKLVVQMHKELDALCRHYACDDRPEASDAASSYDMLVWNIQRDAANAINFATNLVQVDVGHPRQEITAMHRRIVTLCGKEYPCRSHR